MTNNFVHLHLHTEYSLLDGANKISDLIPYLKQNKMNACCISDHGWMAGVIDFYKQCTKNNIKPLLAIEAYITEDEDGKEKDKIRDNMHMVLIAKNNKGYQKLLKLSTEAALNNFYYKPRIFKQKLKELSGDIIATSACLGGVLAQKINFNKDQYGNAIECINENKIIQKEIEFYCNIFGDDFYLEIQDWDSGDHFQPIYNKFLIQKGQNMKIPFVITADAHYLKKEDEKLHEMLMAMQLGKTLDQYREAGEMQYGPHFYVKTPQDMLEGAKRWNLEEAYYNTSKIAEQCNVEIELGKYKEPIFNIEEAEDYKEFLTWKNNLNKNQKLECNHHHG